MSTQAVSRRATDVATGVIERFLDANHPCGCGPDEYCPGNADEAQTLARAVLEAAAPHILTAKATEAKANHDHIVEGGNGYSAGFHYALHCITGDSL